MKKLEIPGEKDVPPAKLQTVSHDIHVSANEAIKAQKHSRGQFNLNSNCLIYMYRLMKIWSPKTLPEDKFNLPKMSLGLEYPIC